MKLKNYLTILFALFLFSAANSNLKAQVLPPPPPTYCLPAYTNASCATNSLDYIQSFSTTGGNTNISNLNTGCSHPDGDPNYYFYTGPGNILTANTNQTINLSLTSTLASFAQGYRIWIDYNLDGTFDITTEEVWNSVTTVPGGGTTVTGTFTIPSTAIPGLTRMRVRGRYFSMVIDPCAINYNFGETEDYEVLILPNAPCTAPPVGGSVASNLTTICPGSAATLTLSGVSYGLGETYQWQESTNGGVTFTNLLGQTALTTIVTVNANTTYRCVVSCSGQSANSSTVAITTLSSTGVQIESNDTVVCANSNINLSILGVSASQGFTFQWQESFDGLTYTDISGETNLVTTYNVTDTTYLRCVISCGTSVSNSSVIVATLNPANICYCGPNTATNLGGACGTSTINDVVINGTPLSNLSTGCTTTPGVGAYSVYAASGNTTATLSQLGTYSLDVTTAGINIISVWIDYNQDGTFDASEWVQVAGGAVAPSANGVPSSVQLQIPVTALTGLTGMRIRSRANGNINGAVNACTTFGSGETEDYFVTIAPALPCVAPPTAGAAFATVDSICTAQPFIVTAVGNSIGLGQTYQWQTSTNNVIWTDIVGETNTFATVSQTTTSYYRLAVSCSGQTTYSAIDTVVGLNCLLMSNDSVSTCNTTFYDSNPNGNYATNENYTLTVYPSTPGSVVKVVFNNFDTETGFDILNVYDGIDATAALLNTFTGTFTLDSVQATNSAGALTFVFTSDFVVTQSGWDATVSCVSVNSCVGTPTPGNAEAVDSTVCANNVVNLTLNGNSNTFGTNYQWQESLNGTTWANVAGAINPVYNPTVTDTVYYRCKLTCSTNSSFSTVVMIGINPFFDCYCGPQTSTNLGGFCGGNNIDSVGISNTTLANGNFTCNTVAGFGSYTQYPDTAIYLTASMQQLVPYNLSVQTSGNSIISVWIDFDQSGTFDASEWTQVATTSTAGGISTVSITPPVTSLTGLTGMRIRSRAFGNANGANDACLQMGSGETEDYIVNITQALPCVAPPTPGTVSASNLSTCANTDVDLSVIGNSVGLGQTYQWQESSNGTTFTDLLNDTNVTATVSLGTTNMYYRLNVTCSGQTVSTAAVMISIVECYIFTDGIDSVAAPTCSGIFYDSGANTGNYANNESGSFTFFPATPNSVLQMTFTSFSTENNWDGMMIYDGPDATYPLISSGLAAGFGAATCPAGSYRGTGSPGVVTSTNITGALTFVFTSDGSGVSTGWSANIACIPGNFCTGTPNGGNATALDTSVCINSNIALSVSGNTSGAGIVYQWQESADNITWTNITGANTASTSATVTDTTYYRCTITCAASLLSANSTVVMATLNDFFECYCGPQTATNLGGFCGANNMDSVIIVGTTLNNAGVCATVPGFGAYSSYPATGNTTASLQQLVPYQLSVINNGNSIQSVWIDYDHSGTYDPSEWQQISTTSAAGIASIITINIPVTSLTGLTGMRLRSRANGNINGANDACLQMGSGETQDYIINITPALPCVAPPTAGTASSSTTSTCSSIPFTITLQGGTVGLGQTYQWQSSPDNVVWTNMPLETNATLNTTQNSSTYYRCVVTCSAQSSNSSSIMLNADCITQPTGSNVDTVYTCSGTYYDPNPSGNYAANTNSTLTIYPGTAGNLVQVIFNSFTVENNYDYLLIYDGPNVSSPLINSNYINVNGFGTAPDSSWTGAFAPDTITATNPTGALTFVFSSDGSVNQAGWDATIGCISNGPCATPTITAMGATTFCQGGSVMLMSNVSTVSWTAVGTTTNGATTANVTVNQSGAYYVTNTDPACPLTPPTVSNTINVLVNPNPTVSITVDDASICAGQSATFTATTAALNPTYVWTNATGTGASATTSAAGNVSVTVTSNGCSGTSNVIAETVNNLPSAPTITSSTPNAVLCPGGSIDLTSSYTSGNSWSNSSTLSVISVSAVGPYSVSHTDANGCTSASASITVTPIPAPTVTVVSGNTTFCSGNGSVVLSSNAPTGNVWNTTPSQTTAAITVTTGGTYNTSIVVPGCPTPIVSNSIVLTENSVVAATVTSNVPSICGTANATLTCTTNPSYVSYVWTGNPSTGITGTNNTATVTAPGNYVVTITDANGCSLTPTSVTIGVGTAPTPTITASAVSICEPGTITLTTATGQGIYTWFNTGAAIANSNTNTIVVSSTGIYTVNVVNAGCTGTSPNQVISVNPLPTAAFIATPNTSTPCNGIVSFSNQSSNATAFQWNFADNSPQVNFTNPSHTYKSTGTYNVTLVVQNACGSDTAIVPVSVTSCVGIEDLSDESDVTIFPNPTKNNITVTYNNVDANTFKLEIMSIAGQVIYTETNNQFHGKFQQNIDMSRYAQGVYFVRIVTNSNTISRKIVKE